MNYFRCHREGVWLNALQCQLLPVIGENKTIDTSGVLFLQMRRLNSPSVLLLIILFTDVAVIEGKSILELRIIRGKKIIG